MAPAATPLSARAAGQNALPPSAPPLRFRRCTPKRRSPRSGRLPSTCPRGSPSQVPSLCCGR
ncbi:MAG: hypothetical protein BJ554DRAFT_6295 [Olpidium bornovanus]|uniref:Uncharacterized protein n=1 Tax=Olpidium bornovanus TaxID=278681 RepID=A0A8H8A281_9FUNG|nr:MAG: hypothetical protein BJ554DRAFT_6295 [Olpidium bornovanus]